MVDWYGIKIWHPCHSDEVFEMIEWCKENKIEFITKPLSAMQAYSHMRPFMAYRNSGKIITEEDMDDKESITIMIDGKEIIFEKEHMRFMDIGTSFFVTSEEDMMAFKLRWV